MKQGIKKYTDISPIEFLLQRDALGLKRYRKTAKRDPEKREILLDLGLKKIIEQEEKNFIPVGYRRRRINL
jgi:hypothetical protein